MTTHTQFAKFTYQDFEIECKVEWSDDGKDLTTNFFNPQTGYTNQSDPASVMSGWSYQDTTDNYEIWSLIEAIRNLTDWTDHLVWEDNTTDEFMFEWHNNLYSNEVAHYNDTGEPTYYKDLTLVRIA